MNVLDSSAASGAIDKLIVRQKLESLRIASGLEWQKRLGLPEQIPTTVFIAAGEVRVVHDSVMADPVSFLEADLKAIHK
jgi:hypothetical protein